MTPTWSHQTRSSKTLQIMLTDPRVCIPPLLSWSLPLFFHLSPFALRLLTAKYLHSYFGWQYVIPSRNQELSFKRWPLLTSDPGCSPTLLLPPFSVSMDLNSQVEKWEQEKSIAIHRPAHSPLLPCPKKERKMNETHSSISRWRRKPISWKASQEAERVKEKVPGKKWRGVREAGVGASCESMKMKT